MPKIEDLVAAVFDTHVWVWTAAGEERAKALESFRGQIFISAISQWEVAMLEMKGRLGLKPDLETWLGENLACPVSLVPLSGQISVTSCQLPDFHGDPADRMIVATAMTLGIPLVTADEKIIRWSREHPLLQIIPI
jgi:PIN domain nuclease of toxin-antitoxin system